ncbi:MAG: M23 family metallopeptidase [Actinomycetes bacterium]
MLRRILPWVLAVLAVPLAVVPGIAIGASPVSSPATLAGQSSAVVQANDRSAAAGSEHPASMTGTEVQSPSSRPAGSGAAIRDRVALASLLDGAPTRGRSQTWVMPLASFTVSEGFGVPGPHWSSGFHTGQDLAAPAGTPVVAAHRGTVLFAGWAGPYGNLVTIAHEDGTQTWYAHLSQILVSPGPVGTGQPVGRVGCTGNCFGTHLHFEVRLGPDLPVNPLLWLALQGVDVSMSLSELADQPRTLPEAARVAPGPVGTATSPAAEPKPVHGAWTGSGGQLPDKQPAHSGSSGSPEVDLSGLGSPK